MLVECLMQQDMDILQVANHLFVTKELICFI